MTKSQFHTLIDRVRGGDSNASEQLVSEYGETIRREVRFSLLDQRLRRIVAESDIFQSVVSRFVFGLRDGDFEFQSGKDVVNLLKVMVRSRIAQHARFWSSQRRDVKRNRALISDDTGLQQDSLPLGERHANAEMAEKAMHLIPDQDRKILQWRDDGVDWTDIAERLDFPSADAVRKAHQRSLSCVQESLRTEFEG